MTQQSTQNSPSSVGPRKIGAHVSAAGGIELALERAKAIGCNCVQVFSGSPRVWFKPPLEKFDPKKISSKEKELGVSPIFTHALYLVNLASEKPELIQKSINTLIYELRFDARVNGAGVIVHLGSHLGNGFTTVQAQLVDRLEEILTNTPEKSRLLIENAASRRGKIGGDLLEIKYLLEQLESRGKWVSRRRVGWCFDTCHGWAAGYYLGETSEGLSLDALSVYATMKEYNLLDSLGCIHVNDSRDPFASNRDRHANLGEGLIPLADLKWFLNRPELVRVPLLMEVPGVEGNGPDAENISRLKAIIAP